MRLFSSSSYLYLVAEEQKFELEPAMRRKLYMDDEIGDFRRFDCLSF